jgi:multidrug efflux pump subunit AcrA (membrane-fusion protein)
MEYPELDLTDVTSGHIDTFLSSFQLALRSAPELAGQWSEMDEAEQFDFRLDFTRAFGLRRVLGALYRAGRLTADQATRLASVDRQLLERAAAVEVVYGLTLGQLVRHLFAWGTPLAEEAGTLRIETTIAALAELAQVEADTHQPAAVQLA